MGGFIKGSNAQRVETTGVNQKINKEVFDSFKDACKEAGYPMNVVLEVFMQQYGDGRFYIDEIDIVKWKKYDEEVSTLNTTFNKRIYLNFKHTCKSKKYFVKNVIMAFMEKFASGSVMLEYVEKAEVYGYHKNKEDN